MDHITPFELSHTSAYWTNPDELGSCKQSGARDPGNQLELPTTTRNRLPLQIARRTR
jgi:hypothetical protein